MARERTFPSEVGLRLGSEGPPVEELQRYLARFGYLASDDAGGYTELRESDPAPEPTSGQFDFPALKQCPGHDGLASRRARSGSPGED